MYMVKAESHIQTEMLSRKQGRRYSGEVEAEGLVRWLNECKDQQAQKRIRCLVDAVFLMVSAACDLPNGADYEDDPDGWFRHTSVRKFRACESRVRRLLKPYRAVPWVMAWKAHEAHAVKTFFSWSAIDRWSSVRHGLSEFGAVLSIMRIGPEQLFRVYFCRCGKALFQRFAHQKFCSDACRIRFYSDDPKWKIYRATKAREYYQLHKNKNIK
jgi:hypothetical protein